jgi:protein ImuB
VVFTEKQANAMRLTALSRAAATAGLTIGLTLADARAREPGLVAIDRDHAAEARLLARIVAGAVRYTPMAAAEPPDGAVFDITGCTTPYGDARGLARDLARRLADGGVGARFGIGTTPEAARARARFGGFESDLHMLPVEALEADAEATRSLRRAGLKTIGALACRPRAMLAARFGALAIRLGRLLEEDDRHISPDRPLPPIVRIRRFAEPIGRVEDALACLSELLSEAAEMLEQRHEGGRRFEARLFRSDGAIAALAIDTGQPTRDPPTLIRLFGERIDALSDPIDPGFGFDQIRLDIVATEPLAHVQQDYTRTSQRQEELAQLIDRLATRLGPRRIRRAAPADTHIPERAAIGVAPATLKIPPWQVPPATEPALRPLHLLDPPQPIAATLSEVPDGPPRLFTWRGRAHEVAAWEGPERIAAEWWRRPGPPPEGPPPRAQRTRDYYRVEDKEGRRYWLFRHGLYEAETDAPDWYLHGLFA